MKSLWLKVSSECLAAAKEEGAAVEKNGYSQDGRS
jgi:hypothetical protein